MASWCLILVSLPLAGWVLSTVQETTYTEEGAIFVDDVKLAKEEAARGQVIHAHGVDGAAVAHGEGRVGEHVETGSMTKEKEETV